MTDLADRALSFHPLTYVTEGTNVLVGRPDSDDYVVLEPDAVAALHRLEAGDPPAAVAAWYRATYGEDLDVDDYVDTLRALGFVSAAPVGAVETRPLRHQRLGRVLFAPPALLAYALLCALAVVLMVRDPHFAPRPSNVFFVSSVSVVAASVKIAQLPLLLAHEAAHALAGRRVGVPSRLGVTRRLYFFVFETRLPGLLGVPRRRRYLCFLAGMIFDAVAIAVLTVVAYALRADDGAWGVVGRFCLAMAFPVAVRFGYQFALILQTDLYHLAVTATGCYDLHAASKAVLARWRDRLLRRRPTTTSMDAWTARDAAFARVYAPVFALGCVALVGVWVFAFVPVLWTLARDVWVSLTAGSTDPHFVDRAVFVGLNVAEMAVLVTLSGRERRRERRAVAITTTTRDEVVTS